jgi:outer membrane protein assembly factor BamB
MILDMSRTISKKSSKTAGFLLLFILYSSLGWQCKSIVVQQDSQINPKVENWPLFGGDFSRTNYRQATLSPPLNNYWLYKASSAIGPTLLAVDGYLFFSTLDGRLYTLNIKTGNKIGRIKTEDSNEATCAYYKGKLIIASRYGELTLANYNLETGKYLWKIDAGDIASEPLVTDEGIFVAAQYKHIDKYHFETGEKLWSFKTEDQHRSSPAISKNVLVVGCDDGMIYGLNAKSGKLKWKFETGAAVFATPSIWDETVFVGSLDSVFYALNLLDGTLRWSFRTETPIYQSAATDGKNVIFGSSGGRLYCLNAETGQEIWRFQAKSVVSTPPVISGRVVYFGSLDRHYYGLSLEDGKKLWDYETRGRIRTAPVVWGKYVFGASENKFVYAFIQPDSLDL